VLHGALCCGGPLATIANDPAFPATLVAPLAMAVAMAMAGLLSLRGARPVL